MAPRLSLFIDLGDAFTKGVALVGARSRQFRFPSVVATRLLSGGAEMTELSLDGDDAIPRPVAFAAERFPRTRSYPRSAAFVKQVRQQPPASGARFAGRIAALYGADRRLLGRAATPDVVEALVHKAIILSHAEECSEADVTFVLDAGAKGAAIELYAAEPHTVSLELHSYKRNEPRRLRLNVRASVIDAPKCLLAALPGELVPRGDGALLTVDIGFLRTKLSVLSSDGCEHQEEIDALGTSLLVQRILRDGQDQGLVEDEFAVIRALEETGGAIIEVAGRRFEVGEALRSGLRSFEQELGSVVERAIYEHFRRRGQSVRALAISGGGSVLAGPGLGQRIERAGLGLGAVWVAPDPSFLLVEGAHVLSAAR
jgi:hypothetical protein